MARGDMQLSSLIGPEIAAPAGCGAIDVTGITADSRKAGPGVLFVALVGTKADGARYIVDAIAKGAVAVLAGRTAEVPAGLPVPVLRADEPRRALALAAARFFAVQPRTAVAVTGTNGKTSVGEVPRQNFAEIGRTAASVG